jgi:D-sedoheptulose 7-phosphate isomerase
MGATMSFSEDFLGDTVAILSQIDATDVEAVVDVLRATRDQGGRLFFGGSGGGAGHASHAACDFRKLAGFEAYCISDNVSELTARVNDDGWDSAYSNWLRASRLRAGDCLFVFSVGGGSIEPPVSMNLLKSVELAKEVGASVVGVVGRDGGAVRSLADASVLLPTVDPKLVTPQTEGLQALVWHLIVSHPALAASVAKWEGIEASAAAGT